MRRAAALAAVALVAGAAWLAAVAGSLDPVPWPDFTVTAVGLDPEGPAPGQHVTFFARVRNDGAGDATYPFGIVLFLDNRARWVFRFPSLAAGGELEVRSPAWSASIGSHSIRASADAYGEHGEPNEANNNRVHHFAVNIEPLVVKPDEDARGLVAVSGSGNATGYVAVSGSGQAEAYWLAATVEGPARGCTDGSCAAVSATGPAESCQPFVTCFAASGTGHAQGYAPLGTGRCDDWACLAVTAEGPAEAYWLGVTGDGPARGVLAASRNGPAEGVVAVTDSGAASGLAALSLSGSSDGIVAVSGTGDAVGIVPLGLGTCNGRGCFEARAAGDAPAYWAGATGDGDSTGWLAFTGHGDTPGCAAVKAAMCAGATLDGDSQGTAAVTGAGTSAGEAALAVHGAAVGTLALSGTGSTLCNQTYTQTAPCGALSALGTARCEHWQTSTSPCVAVGGTSAACDQPTNGRPTCLALGGTATCDQGAEGVAACAALGIEGAACDQGASLRDYSPCVAAALQGPASCTQRYGVCVAVSALGEASCGGRAVDALPCAAVGPGLAAT